MLARAERLHREFFHWSVALPGVPAWAPLIVYRQTERQVLVLVALRRRSGAVSRLSSVGLISSSGAPVLPAELRTAVIHRIELPQEPV